MPQESLTNITNNGDFLFGNIYEPHYLLRTLEQQQQVRQISDNCRASKIEKREEIVRLRSAFQASIIEKTSVPPSISLSLVSPNVACKRANTDALVGRTEISSLFPCILPNVQFLDSRVINRTIDDPLAHFSKSFSLVGHRDSTEVLPYSTVSKDQNSVDPIPLNFDYSANAKGGFIPAILGSGRPKKLTKVYETNDIPRPSYNAMYYKKVREVKWFDDDISNEEELEIIDDQNEGGKLPKIHREIKQDGLEKKVTVSEERHLTERESNQGRKVNSNTQANSLLFGDNIHIQNVDNLDVENVIHDSKETSNNGEDNRMGSIEMGDEKKSQGRMMRSNLIWDLLDELDDDEDNSLFEDSPSDYYRPVGTSSTSSSRFSNGLISTPGTIDIPSELSRDVTQKGSLTSPPYCDSSFVSSICLKDGLSESYDIFETPEKMVHNFGHTSFSTVDKNSSTRENAASKTLPNN